MQGHLVAHALDPRKPRHSADPLVQLGHEATARYLHWRLEVHDLVRDMELVVDGLGRRYSSSG